MPFSGHFCSAARSYIFNIVSPSGNGVSKCVNFSEVHKPLHKNAYFMSAGVFQWPCQYLYVHLYCVKCFTRCSCTYYAGHGCRFQIPISFSSKFNLCSLKHTSCHKGRCLTCENSKKKITFVPLKYKLFSH